MKLSHLLLLSACACTHRTDSAPDAPVVGKVVDTVTCRADPSQSYALYIPAGGRDKRLPVVYCFDPHGAGALPLNKYKSLADAYGFILAGSNNSKNGNDWTTAENIWRCLSRDVLDRCKVDTNRMYTCGFSGGAKVASYVAMMHPGIKGVIVGGTTSISALPL
jgi:predicted peptidase